MSIFDRADFDAILANIIYDSRVQSPDCDIATDESADVSRYGDDWEDDAMGEDDVYFEDDGQPTMYEEYQDLYDGDDWDHGQYDEY